MRFLTRSLITRLMLYFVMVALVSMGVAGYIIGDRVQLTVEQQVFRHLNTVATLKEEELNRWLTDKQAEVLQLGQASTVSDSAMVLLANPEDSGVFKWAYSRLSSYLEQRLAESPDILEVWLLSGEGGKVVFSTNTEHEGVYLADSAIFIEGRKDTYVQNVYLSPVLWEMVTTIATPVTDVKGKLIGVLAVHLNLNRLDEIMLERTGLGATGETYVVDRFGDFVSAARFGETHLPRGVHTEGIDAALDGEEGISVYQNYRDMQVIGAYKWVDDLGLALLAEIEAQEAFEPVRQITIAMLVAGGIMTVLVLLFSYALARQIFRPIAAVTATATQIAAGDLTQRAPVLTQDEIGTLAGAFNDMTGRLQDMMESLERRVAERTKDIAAANVQIRQRAVQLRTVAEVAQAASGTLDAGELLDMVVDLARDQLDLYYVGIFLVDEARRYAWLRAGTGEAGKAMLERQHRLEVGGHSMIGWCVARAQARIALDVGADAVRFDNPLLPATRSEMALPLISRGEVLGAMTVQSEKERAFTEEDITILQTMANQVANAIANVQLYDAAQARLQEMTALTQRYQREAWTEFLATEEVGGYYYDRREFAPMPRSLLPATAQAIEHKESTVLPEQGQLVVPIMLRGEPLGAMGVSAPTASYQWSEEEITLLETIVEQLAVAIENAWLFEEVQRRAWRERLVGEVGTKLRATTDLDTILQTAADELARALNVPRSFVQLWTDTGLGGE